MQSNTNARTDNTARRYDSKRKRATHFFVGVPEVSETCLGDLAEEKQHEESGHHLPKAEKAKHFDGDQFIMPLYRGSAQGK